jgi:hypothetical protein
MANETDPVANLSQCRNVGISIAAVNTADGRTSTRMCGPSPSPLTLNSENQSSGSDR